MVAATTIPIFLVVRDSHKTDLHSCVAWGADDLCESDFDVRDSANEWESLGDKAGGESESRDVGKLLRLCIHLYVRYHLPDWLGQFGVNGFRPSKKPSRGKCLRGRTCGRL